MFKSVALGNLSTDLPQLDEFPKKDVEDYGFIFTAVFFKKLKSNEIMAVESYFPASTMFQFKPQLMDAILETEESTTLLSSFAKYVKTCHRRLGNFAIQAFKMNKRQLIICLDRVLSTLLYKLAKGLIVNANKNKESKKNGGGTDKKTRIFAAAVAKPPEKAPQPSLAEEPTGQATLPQAAKETSTRPARAENLLGRNAPFWNLKVQLKRHEEEKVKDSYGFVPDLSSPRLARIQSEFWETCHHTRILRGSIIWSSTTLRRAGSCPRQPS